ALEIFSNLKSDSLFYLPRTVQIELNLFTKKDIVIKDKLVGFLKNIHINYINIDDYFIEFIERHPIAPINNPKTIDLTVIYSSIMLNAKTLTFDRKIISGLSKLNIS
ncbi:hypothetical protein KBD45_05245, partial [Candidatus Dojkabacteria bacterium]|nr:hypothetical protein [Candidatus Dojkabacteria bacterium]